jgi:hypothetical protein
LCGSPSLRPLFHCLPWRLPRLQTRIAKARSSRRVRHRCATHAYPNSLLAWRSAVKDKYGSEYNSWRYAKDRDVVCDEKGGQWVCKRKAKPCKDVLHRVIDSATAAAKANCKDDSLSSYGAKKKAEKAAMTEATTGWEIDARKSTAGMGEGDNAASTTSTVTRWAAGISYRGRTPCMPVARVQVGAG